MDIVAQGRRVFALPPQSSLGNLVCYNHSDWTANKMNPQSLQIFLSSTYFYQIGWTMIDPTIEGWLLTLVLSFLEHFSLKAIKIFLKSVHLFLALSAFFLLGGTKPGGFIFWEDEVEWEKKRDWIHLLEFKENFSLWMLTPKIDQQNSLSKSAVKRLGLQTLNRLCYYDVLRKSM